MVRSPKQLHGLIERGEGGGGRHWTRTSDLLHVKHFRLSAVLRAQRVEHKRISYAVTVSASPAARLAVTRDASLTSVLASHSHSVGVT